MKKIIWLIVVLAVIGFGIYWFVALKPSGMIEAELQKETTFDGQIEQVTSAGFSVRINPIEEYETPYDEYVVTLTTDNNTKVYGVGDGIEPWDLSGLTAVAQQNIAEGNKSWIRVKTTDPIINGATIYAFEIMAW